MLIILPLTYFIILLFLIIIMHFLFPIRRIISFPFILLGSMVTFFITRLFVMIMNRKFILPEEGNQTEVCSEAYPKYKIIVMG